MPKSLSEPRTRAIKDFAQRLVRTDFGGSVSAAARALKIQQSQLSDLLNDRRGLGLVAIERVADYVGASLDEVVGRTVPRKKPADRREIAAELAREDDIQDAAIQSVLAEELRPDDERHSTLWWARRMRAREVELEAGGPTDPAATTVRKKRA